jgi:hypothetical protein
MNISQTPPLLSYTAPEANRAVQLFAAQQAEYAKLGLGYRLGIPSFDANHPALLPGDMAVFHGMAGERKSTVTRKVSGNILAQMSAMPPRVDGRHRRLLYVSTEEGVEKQRISLWNDRKITSRGVREGKTNPEDIKQRAILTSGDPILFIGPAQMSSAIHPNEESMADFGAITVHGIASTMYRAMETENIAPEVVVIDHMHDLSVEGMGNRASEYDLITVVFRQLAWFKDWSKTVVLLVCQDNNKAIVARDAEERQPLKEDIANSSAVFRKAAIIFSIWSPSKHLKLGAGDVYPLDRLTPHGHQTLNVTTDSILVEVQKTREAGEDIEGTTLLLSGRGATGVWGDVQEVDTSKWPIGGSTGGKKNKKAATAVPQQAEQTPLNITPKKGSRPKLDPIEPYTPPTSFKEEIELDPSEWERR